MAKDPAFLFYPGDYLRDTQNFTEHQQVAYDRIMCEHMRNICITQAQLNFFTKRLTPEEKKELLFYLKQVDGGFQIEWVAESIVKRRSYSESRRQNKEGKYKIISKSYDSHMENENINENKDTNVIEDVIKEWNEFSEKHGLTKIIKTTDKRVSNIKQRLAEKDFNIYHIFQRIEESEFLRGKNKEGWKADFDFVFGSKNNWVKIMEGKYANNKGSIRKPNFVSSEEIADELNQAFSKSRAAT